MLHDLWFLAFRDSRPETGAILPSSCGCACEPAAVLSRKRNRPSRNVSHGIVDTARPPQLGYQMIAKTRGDSTSPHQRNRNTKRGMTKAAHRP